MSPHARVAAPGTWRGRSTTPRRASAGRSGRESRRSRRHQLPQLLEPRRSDAGDGVEVVDRAEGAVLLAVIDDLLAGTAQPGGWAVLSTAIFYRSEPYGL